MSEGRSKDGTRRSAVRGRSHLLLPRQGHPLTSPDRHNWEAGIKLDRLEGNRVGFRFHTNRVGPVFGVAD
jgi:hypothetical protein